MGVSTHCLLRLVHSYRKAGYASHAIHHDRRSWLSWDLVSNSRTAVLSISYDIERPILAPTTFGTRSPKLVFSCDVESPQDKVVRRYVRLIICPIIVHHSLP